MFPMGGAKCCTLLSALVWFPLSPCMGEDQTRPWDEGSCSGAGLGHSWAQQCWQVPPRLFAQVTPHSSCGKEGAAPQRALHSAALFSPSLSTPTPALVPRACALPHAVRPSLLSEGSQQEPWARRRAGLPCGSAVVLRTAHPTARCHLPCLLLSLCQCKGGISVQKQILQHLIHPLHWCERGGELVPLHLRVACQEPGGVVRSLRTRCHRAGWGLTLPPLRKLSQLFYLSCF